MLPHEHGSERHHFDGVFFCCRQLPHLTVVYSHAGPGLSLVGILLLGTGIVPVSDIRRRRRNPSVSEPRDTIVRCKTTVLIQVL